MKFIESFFSFKLVIVFGLVSFLGAVLKPVDARGLEGCPCPFATLYQVSIAQAKEFGRTNKVETCFKSSELFSLEGGVQELGACFTGMGIFDLTGSPHCDYLYFCNANEELDLYVFSVDEIPLSPREVRACQFQLKVLAFLNGLLPCEEPT